MQKFEGEGVLFVELDGSTVEYELQAGEQLVLDTGHLAIMDGTCNMDIQTVKGAKNIFFGGEGLFNTVVTGPGKVVVQTLPVNKLALELYRYMPKSGGNGVVFERHIAAREVQRLLLIALRPATVLIRGTPVLRPVVGFAGLSLPSGAVLLDRTAGAHAATLMNNKNSNCVLFIISF